MKMTEIKNSKGGLDIYFSQISKYPLLSFEEEQELFKRLSETDDEEKKKEIKDELTNRNLRLVAHTAKRGSKYLPLEDCIQNGTIGLLTAIERFDYTKGYKFSTYATWWISQAISRGIDDEGKSVRLPAHIKENIRKMNKAIEQIRAENLVDIPTVEEIAEKTGFTEEKVRNLLILSKDAVSLDVSYGTDESNQTVTLSDYIEDPKCTNLAEDKVFEEERKEAINRMLSTLSERESYVIKKRFGLENGTCYTLDQIGKELNLTRERVRQIETRALQHLKTRYGTLLRDYI